MIEGSVGQYYYPSKDVPPTTLWLLAVFSFLIFAWYRRDSMQLGYPRTVALNIGIVALHFIVLPYYFFQSRGLKKGFVAVVFYVLTLLGSILLSSTAAIFTSYALQS
jgi:hypothetical protein